MFWRSTRLCDRDHRPAMTNRSRVPDAGWTARPLRRQTDRSPAGDFGGGERRIVLPITSRAAETALSEVHCAAVSARIRSSVCRNESRLADA